MKASPFSIAGTIFLFFVALLASAYPLPAAQAAADSEETSKLVREADEAYQNGNFKLAIEKYQKAMQVINEKKELAQTKQELFQTMISLALTYFTIQENAKAEKQLQDLVMINPNQELDPEYYPPRFLELFRGVQKNSLGRLAVSSSPPGAAIFLGADKLGQAPLRVEKILKGNYQLKAELAGFAPLSREIVVQADKENIEEVKLEKIQPVIEKTQPPPQAKTKKKKKLSPLVIIGGAALAATAIVLLTAKKEEPQKQLQALTFTEKQAVTIDPILPSYMPINTSGVTAKIEKVDFRVVIEHPHHMEDLIVTIIGTDNRTLFNIWNRGQSADAPAVITGSTNAFDNLAPNGTWRLMVQNPGRSLGGRILEFTLKIYFFK